MGRDWAYDTQPCPVVPRAAHPVRTPRARPARQAPPATRRPAHGRDWAYAAPLPLVDHRATRSTPTRRQVVTIGLPAVGAVVLLTSASSAFWTVSGSGAGSGAAATSAPLTTTATTPVGTLYPGATTGLALSIRNPNPFPVTVTAVSGAGTITASGGVGTCTTTGVTFTGQTGLSLAVPARVGSTDGALSTTLAGSLAMSNASETGCQGATFTVPVVLTGGSAAP